MKENKQKANYTALRNGVKVFQGTLEDVIQFIRTMELDLDRSKEHSPWSVGLED
jgi:hypothetical protein